MVNVYGKMQRALSSTFETVFTCAWSLTLFVSIKVSRSAISWCFDDSRWRILLMLTCSCMKSGVVVVASTRAPGERSSVLEVI